MAATLGSTLLGFAREVVNATYYGTQWQMDTFLAASVIPTILFGVFNGAFVSALVPTFSDYVAADRREEGWRLASTIVNLLVLVMTACALIGYALAPWYVPLIAHGFPKPQLVVAVHMTRLFMPSVVGVALAGVFSGILNAYGRFRSASVIGMVLNAVTIAVVVLLNAKFGIYALVFGTAIGLLAQAIVQVPAFLLLGGYRFTIDLAHPGLKRMWGLLAPIAVGSAAGQLAMFFDRFFASTLSPGYMAGMNYAIKLVGFPQQIFAAAIATVIFPLLAAQFAGNDRAGVVRSTTIGLRLVNFITIPAICALVALAVPIVSTLFERGSFGQTSVALTAGLLPFSAVGLFAVASNIVLMRCLFACRNTSWPIVGSVATVVLNVALSILWLPTLGARGLLLANSLSQTAQMVFLLVLVDRHVAQLEWRVLISSAVRVGASALAMLFALDVVVSLGMHPNASLGSRVFALLGDLVTGGVVFLAASRVLGVEELSLAWRAILDRFERNLIPPPESREAPIA